MSKGSRTTQDAKRYIIRRALEEPKTADRTELAKNIRQELLAKKTIPPAMSTLKSMISTARNRKLSPEDQPWHMGTFKVYAPSAEGLVAIWKAYRFVIDQRDTLSKEKSPKPDTRESDAMLTIRQAKWIARLDPVVRMLHAHLDEEVLVPLVIDRAVFYAEHELLCEVTKTPFNTETIDGNLARATAILHYDGWDVNHFRGMVFSYLFHTKRTKEEMKKSFNDPFEREQAELIAESKKKKPGDKEYWRQYNERLNSISDRRKTRDLDEWEREAEVDWQKRIGATNPELCKELATAYRAAVPVVLTKPPAKWTDEDRRLVDEYERLERYAESLEAGQGDAKPVKKDKKSKAKKGAK